MMSPILATDHIRVVEMHKQQFLTKAEQSRLCRLHMPTSDPTASMNRSATKTTRTFLRAVADLATWFNARPTAEIGEGTTGSAA